MPVETLEDIVEELANNLYIYGEERSCWTGATSRRILDAVRNDAALCTYATQGEDTPLAVARDLPLMHYRCMSVGLFATGQLMHEVVKSSGYELAELLNKKATTRFIHDTEQPR